MDIKRKPMNDGRLELTESEMEELKEKCGIHRDIKKVIVSGDTIEISLQHGNMLVEGVIVANISVIKYLLDRFELEV